jgi:PII-like signaling protein
MEIPAQSALLRIYTEEARRDGGRPLYESVVLKARDAGLAGATVLRGLMGYGVSARLHTAKILDLSANLPLVIEIVDAEPKLRDFAAGIVGMSDIGLVTLEKVEVLHYGHAPSGQAGR